MLRTRVVVEGPALREIEDAAEYITKMVIGAGSYSFRNIAGNTEVSFSFLSRPGIAPAVDLECTQKAIRRQFEVKAIRILPEILAVPLRS